MLNYDGIDVYQDATTLFGSKQRGKTFLIALRRVSLTTPVSITL